MYTVTYHLGTHFLGSNCRYGTHFLAEKRCVQNDFFYYEIKKTDFKVVIQNFYIIEQIIPYKI